MNERKNNQEEKLVTMPKYSRYLTLVDNETGEVAGHFQLKRKTLGKGWVALYQEAMSNLADAKLSYEEYRVFLKLIGKVDFENYLRISQTQIAKELHMKQSHIARAIKGLKEREILIEGPRAGLNKTYRLNPYIAHRGKDRDKTIIDFEKASKRK